MSLHTKRIGEKVSILAGRFDKNQEELAESIGVTSATVNRFFNGKRDMHASAFVSLLKEFDIDLEDQISKKTNNLTGIQNNPESAQEAFNYLFSELGELGKQTILNQMLWTVKITSAKSLPKKIENQIKNEITLI